MNFKKHDWIIAEKAIMSLTAPDTATYDIPVGSFGHIRAVHINDLYERTTYVIEFENSKIAHANFGFRLATPLDKALS